MDNIGNFIDVFVMGVTKISSVLFIDYFTRFSI